MNIFTLFGEIAINKEKAEKDIDAFTKKVSNLVEKVGEFTIDLVGNAAKNTNVISDYAKKFGMTYERVQELNYVLTQSGSSIEQFEGSLTGFAAKMDRANEGNKAAVELFGRLGVAVAGSNNNLRNQGDVLWDTLSALQAMENETERAAMATQIFGSNGSTLIDVLSGEKGTIEDLQKQAHDLNLILSDELVEGGARFNESIDLMNYNLATAGTTIGAAFLPSLTNFLTFINNNSDEILGALQGVGNWIVKNSEAVGAALMTMAAGFAAGAIAAHPYAAAVLAVVAGLNALQTGGSRSKEALLAYSDEELSTLQNYIDALNTAKEAEEAYFKDEWSMADPAKNKVWLDTKEKLKQAQAELDMVEGLEQAYKNWLGTQGAEGIYLDVPARVEEGSEDAIQSELNDMSFQAVVDLVANPSGLGTLNDIYNKYSSDGSHANGLDRVPFDGYRAILHRNEAVLTAGEAELWRSGFTPDNGMGEIRAELHNVSTLLKAIMTNTGRNQNITLDTGVLVGQIAPRIDSTLGTIASRRSRG